MHIPDGFLSTPVWSGLWGGGAVALAIVAARARRKYDDRLVPMMGVLGAFVFAAQMINIPVPGGTSGHLVGAVLLCAVMGPAAALLALACVLLIQCLLFQDGGLTAFGANFVNMGIVGGLLGWATLQGVRRLLRGRLSLAIGAFLGGWIATMAGAAAAAGEIALSGKVPLTTVLVAMLGWHALIGVIEGLGTMVVLRVLEVARPDLVELRS